MWVTKYVDAVLPLWAVISHHWDRFMYAKWLWVEYFSLCDLRVSTAQPGFVGALANLPAAHQAPQ